METELLGEPWTAHLAGVVVSVLLCSSDLRSVNLPWRWALPLSPQDCRSLTGVCRFSREPDQENLYLQM